MNSRLSTHVLPRAEQGKQYGFANVAGISQNHHQAIDTKSETAGWRHAVFQGE